MRKDILAAGLSRTANYGFSGSGDDEVVLHNVAPEGSKDDTVIETVAKVAAPAKKFNPMPEVYLVRQHDANTLAYGSVSEGLQAGGTGIVLVADDKAKERPSEGTIVEAGSKTSYAPGTHVVFGTYSGTQFKLNGEVFLLMKDEDLFGEIVTPTPEEDVEELQVFPGLENTSYTVARA